MLPSDYEELKRIDTILLCGICYEYMDTTVITPCSHNYCSLCIRKYLHYKTQCPTCFEEVFEKDLRVNKALDEIKQYFLVLKDKLAKCVQSLQNDKLSTSHCNSSKFMDHENNLVIVKQPNVGYENTFNDEAQRCITTNVDKIVHTSQDSGTPLLSPSTSKAAKVLSFFTPKSKKVASQNVNSDEVVICPVCKVNVSEKNINRHLDDCLKREVIKNKPVKIKPKRKPLPKLVLSLMKEAEIKKKLRELGLSHVGDRKALVMRLQRYTTLYNAECDKENPRSVPELIKLCDDEENLEKKANQLTFVKLQVNRNTADNVIEEERKKYLEMNKNSFESLISKIKCMENPKKPSARRSILNENVAVEASSAYSTNSSNLDLQNSDSDVECPLQMYSSENPMNFFNSELLSSNEEVKDINNVIDKVEKEKEEDGEKEEEKLALANTSAGFFYSEIEKTNSNNNSHIFVNKCPIVSHEVPCSSNTSANMIETCIEKDQMEKTKSTTKEMQQENNDNLKEMQLEDYTSDFSSNDSIIYNSDFETFEKQIYNIIKDIDVKESVITKSKPGKENIKRYKKRKYDNAICEEANVSTKRNKSKVQTNFLSEQNIQTFNGEHFEEANHIENKRSTRLRKGREEQLASGACTPQRKSKRLLINNNYSINNNTTER
ncbi:hypothetical protein M0804_000054 [Polistes exclamans]|nr:hypothetical protein M0804_000054 [Polistes exclamans]